MSTQTAIGAVTQRLVQILKPVTPNITAKPPDKAGESRLNIFLYHIAINAAMRNQDLPRPSGRGQPARPLLPLNLYYLITASNIDATSSDEISDIDRHNILGHAMLLLHDGPDLDPFDAGSGIVNQPEPIRIRLQPLSLDEMYKLWGTFQTAYRPSVAYEVSVVLIESDLTDTTPLPVTRRGEDARGWDSSTQFPATLNSVRFQTPNQPGARLGEKLTLLGRNLTQLERTRVAFRHHHLATSLTLTPSPGSDEITVDIPNSPAKWPAGIYMVSVQNIVGTGDGQHVYSSNEFPVALLPEIVVPPGGLNAVPVAGGKTLISLTCRPELKAGQRCQILIGQVAFDGSESSNATTLKATWTTGLSFPANERRFARLRIDGVESLVYDPQKPEQGFDPNLEVKGIP